MGDQTRTFPPSQGWAAIATRLPIILALLTILFGLTAWYSHKTLVVERHQVLVTERASQQAERLADQVEQAARRLQEDVDAAAGQVPPELFDRVAGPRLSAALETELAVLMPRADRVVVLSAGDPRFELNEDFVAQVLAQRILDGQQAGPEILRRDQSWQVAVATPLSPDGEGPSAAAILFLPSDVLALPTDDTLGELRLTQAFPGGRPQHFHTVGSGDPQYRATQSLAVPHWQLTFAPGGALASQVGLLTGKLARNLSALAALLCLVGAIALKVYAQIRLNREKRLRKQRQQETEMQRYHQALSLLDQFHEEDAFSSDGMSTDGVGERGPAGDDYPLMGSFLPGGDGHAQVLFREYDIRGDADRLLSDELVTDIGRVIGSEVLELGDRCVVVGWDGRLSSPRLLEALTDGLLETGCDVIDLGLVPTPVMNFAALTLDQTRSGIMITASHNPPGDNGFKIVIAGEALSGARIQALYQRILAQDFAEGQGILSHREVQEDYLERILADIEPARLKVVLDCANGAAGPLASELLSRLGCDVIPLYCDPDGRFPNHAPDPSREQNLSDLKLTVKSQGADLGIALDGDGDRMVAVTGEGRVVWPDELMMIFARDVLSRQPGANIVFDVKSTYRLPALISAYGGNPMMRRTGHSYIRNAVAREGAPLGGEYSGHLFFPDRWFGFDDGLYAAARLIEVITLREQPLGEIVATLPTSVASPEMLIPVEETDKFRIIEQLQAGDHFADAEIDTTDGLRVQWSHGWGLVRASNTSAQLTLRFEADSQAHLDEIEQRFREVLARIDPKPDIFF